MPNERPEYITGGKARGKGEVSEGTLKGEGYDRKDFYIRSVDNHGNRDSVRVDSMKCPPYLNALVQKWVSDERTPYTSASDFWRDSGAHRVHDLEEFAQDPTFDWGYLGVAEKRERLAREARDMHEQTEAFKRDIAAAIDQTDTVWLANIIEVAKDAVGRFREPYRSRIENIIKPYVDGTITLHRQPGS